MNQYAPQGARRTLTRKPKRAATVRALHWATVAGLGVLAGIRRASEAGAVRWRLHQTQAAPGQPDTRTATEPEREPRTEAENRRAGVRFCIYLLYTIGSTKEVCRCTINCASTTKTNRTYWKNRDAPRQQ